MSRGHGAVQRQILDLLATKDGDIVQTRGTEHLATWWSVLAIADTLDPDGLGLASRAFLESVRRAVKKLAAEGLLETTAASVHREQLSYVSWAPKKRVLCARLPERTDQ